MCASRRPGGECATAVGACRRLVRLGAGGSRLRTLDILGAAVEKRQVICNRGIIRLASAGGQELGASSAQIAAQHIGVAFVVENLGALPGEPDGRMISAIGEVESRQTVVARSESDPGCR